MARRPLPHTADTGIEATADSFPALVVELATGMFELMGQPTGSDQEVSIEVNEEGMEVYAEGMEVYEESIEVTAQAAERVDLVYDLLSELLYLSETKGLHLARFEVVDSAATKLTIRATGVPTAKVETVGPPIKAVTYHDLEVGQDLEMAQTGERWRARVYFDV